MAFSHFLQIHSQVLYGLGKGKIPLHASQADGVLGLITVAILKLLRNFFSHLLDFREIVEGNHVLSRPVVFILHQQKHSSYSISHFDELNLVDVLLKIELQLMFEDVGDDEVLFLQARQNEKRILVQSTVQCLNVSQTD